MMSIKTDGRPHHHYHEYVSTPAHYGFHACLTTCLSPGLVNKTKRHVRNLYLAVHKKLGDELPLAWSSEKARSGSATAAHVVVRQFERRAPQVVLLLLAVAYTARFRFGAHGRHSSP